MKNLLSILLSFIFTRKDFSYKKILSFHIQEKTKISGRSVRANNFLYILPYNTYIREVMWSLKFRNNKHVAHILGLLLYETFPEELILWEQFENFSDPLLITVPSSKQTVYRRGYDQNELIIKSFLKYGGNKFITYQPRVLKKIKHIPKQSRTKSKQERLKNPKGAFAVTNAHLSLIRGRNIILFDDILTTGATTKEIKKLLRKAEASQIKTVVIAH